MRKLSLLSILLLIAGGSAFERTVACSERRVPYFNVDGTEKYQPFKEFPSRSCADEELTRLCRRAFKNTSFATFSDLQEIFLEDPNDHTARNYYNLSLCAEGYNPAEKPNVSEGEWSDLLVGTENEFCANATEWIQRAEKACGTAVGTFNFGGNCTQNGNKFTEFAFVCSKPLNESAFDSYNRKFDRQQAYHEKRQMAILQEFTSAWERLEDAKARGDSNTVALIKTVELEWVRREAHRSNFEAHRDLIFKHYIEHGEKMFEEDLGPTYSKRNSLVVLKNRLKQFGVERSAILFQLASKIIANELDSNEEQFFASEIRVFDVENVTSTFDDSDVLKIFPDLRAPLAAFWVDYCRNHTLGMSPKHLGFLNNSAAHVSLLDHFKQIFKDGKVDETFIDAGANFVNFALAVLPFVFVFGVGFVVGFVVLYAASTFKQYREQRGKITVSYSNFRGRATADDNGLLLRPEL